MCNKTINHAAAELFALVRRVGGRAGGRAAAVLDVKLALVLAFVRSLPSTEKSPTTTNAGADGE